MMKFIIQCILLIITAAIFSCKENPPVVPPVDDTVANTIILTVEWTDLYRINVKWNRAKADTLEPFTYRLTQTDEQGNKTTKEFIIAGKDTNYTAGEPDSLSQGKIYWFKVEGYNSEGKLKDTSRTVEGKTLSPTSHDIVWQIDTLGEAGNSLYDIWGIDENNVWAVGGVNLPEGGSTVIKWNGNKWLPVNPYPLTANSIFGFSEDDIWVAGGGTFGYTAHWNGATWEEYSFYPPPVDTIWGLRSVWGSSPEDVWAVGDLGTIIHWDGVEWRKIESPLDLSLNDVWGTGPDNIYILRTSVNNTSTVARYDGASWEVLTDRIPNGPKNFDSFWMDKSGNGYVVGNSTLYFNGGSFERININQSSYSVRVRGRNAADVIVTGQRSRVYHFNGLGWVNFPELEDNSGEFSEISGIQIFENKIFLVGRTINKAIIFIGEKQ